MPRTVQQSSERGSHLGLDLQKLVSIFIASTRFLEKSQDSSICIAKIPEKISPLLVKDFLDIICMFTSKPYKSVKECNTAVSFSDYRPGELHRAWRVHLCGHLWHEPPFCDQLQLLAEEQPLGPEEGAVPGPVGGGQGGRHVPVWGPDTRGLQQWGPGLAWQDAQCAQREWESASGPGP